MACITLDTRDGRDRVHHDMPFVKLDCGILNSTLWFERECRDVFLTALLMAEPFELKHPTPQIAVDSLKDTGWTVPIGWYGFVPAASVGILHRAGVSDGVGFEALRRLGEPEISSRSPEFDGRRLVRIDGGFLVLNYIKYRERDYTAAERSRRYRQRLSTSRRSVNISRRDDTATSRAHHASPCNITQAEAEAEAEEEKREKRTSRPSVASLSPAAPSSPALDPFTDPVITERAGRFLERYQVLYPKHRHGARYTLRPTRDYAAAVTLCQTWEDDKRLDELAVIFLTTDHKFAAEGSRTVPQFLAVASWCDGRLQEVRAKAGRA